MTSIDYDSQSVILRCAANIKPEAYQWIWQGWLAKGKFHILAGAAGTGKTTIAMSLAATISVGGKFADESACAKGSILIWSAEDSAKDTLVPRLIAAGADLTKIHFIESCANKYKTRGFDPAIDMPMLIDKAIRIDDLSLLVIDPIVNAVAGDSHKNGEVRRGLQPVVDFAEKTNCAVLGITHFSKGGQGKDLLERVTGSIAFAALARIVLVTAKINQSDTVKRIFCRAKSNISIDSGGFEYELEQKIINSDIETSFTSWGYPLEGYADKLFSEADNDENGEHSKSAVDNAKDFLIQLLQNGELAQAQIQEDANGAGISYASIKRAKTSLKLIASKSKLDSRWYWKLPNHLLKND